ncbi:MAG: glycerol-3-phosphate dehydrogenase/oxidase [Moritella sp.]|uniref:glycerol-3-phosphate dehydrogenase/oxidase n=1 Tax=Moritella sp. TaxID=78556 RepID=UPI0029A55D11|nr:glycerol-3-phosphate dehydrogenase/oxidase [Moritella sp.]MDX2321229.1 glycerol-3-phosphate dehydrogenase/oxidase [Moritella sp.]
MSNILANMNRAEQLATLQQTSQPWDMIIVGGGITGAGVLLTASQAGLNVLLIEQDDFAWGASSKSSKMVHGGLRYLGSGQYGLTKDAVTERQKLLNELPGLVDPLQFLMGHYRFGFPGPIVFNTLLTIYDWIGGKRNHSYINNAVGDFYAPGLNLNKLRGATQFADAVTDDARLVMRILQEAQELGGCAINYVKAKSVIQSGEQVTGLAVCDSTTGQAFDLTAKVVVNATGPWTDELRKQLNAKKSIRPLRGSHLIVPSWRLPLAYSVSYFHPDDKRPIFAFPWENSTVIGTTDLDHNSSLDQQPTISQTEVDYLLKGINLQFPQADICEDDVISTFAGIRPVVSSSDNINNTKPSDEKREHSIWNENGLVSVAGGKLTTFRLIALDVLEAAKNYLPNLDISKHRKMDLFRPVTEQSINLTVEPHQLQRLKSHYGQNYSAVINNADSAELNTIASTNTTLAEIKWILANEMVVHLDDLLLRRSRLGLLIPDGGSELFAKLKPLCQQSLNWDDKQWQQEVERYNDMILRHYSLPKIASAQTKHAHIS